MKDKTLNEQPSARRRIIVVEDEVIIATDLRMTLISMGYEVLATVGTGEEAIKKTAELQPDLVLMDIVLKGHIDGIKAARHVMSQYNIPVVFLTSHTDSATFKRAKETGPFGYIVKPYDEKDMRATVEMALYKHRMESDLKRRERWLAVTLKSIGDAVIVTNFQGFIDYLNPTAETLTGYPLTYAMGRHLDAVCCFHDEVSGLPMPSPMQAVPEADEALCLKRPDGSNRSIELKASPILEDDGSVTGMVLVFRDVTERRRAQKMVRQSERFLNTIFDSIQDPFCILDKDFVVKRANEGYARLKQRPLQELVNRPCDSFSQNQVVCEGCIVESSFDDGLPHVQERPYVFPGGVEGWVEVLTYPIKDDQGGVGHVVEYTRDITLRKRAEQDRQRIIGELEYLSSVDALTQLLNRRALVERLDTNIREVKQFDIPLSLFICDIDHFKDINDQHGHDVGDVALKHVSVLIKSISRKSDAVGRYGGDEFMAAMPYTTLQGAREFAQRLMDQVHAQPLALSDGRSIPITLSIGLAQYRPLEDSIDTLVKRADEALYVSKREGRDRITACE